MRSYLLLSCITGCTMCIENRPERNIRFILLLRTLKTNSHWCISHTRLHSNLSGPRAASCYFKHWSLPYFPHHYGNFPRISFLITDSYTLIWSLHVWGCSSKAYWVSYLHSLMSSRHLNSPRPQDCHKAHSSKVRVKVQKKITQSLLHTNTSDLQKKCIINVIPSLSTYM